MGRGSASERARVAIGDGDAHYDRKGVRSVHVSARPGCVWDRRLDEAANGVTRVGRMDQAIALDVAHALALKTIAASETDPRRRRVLDLTREGIEAQTKRRSVPAATLASYAGEYEGGRTLAVDAGRLMYSGRAGAPPEPLVPLSDSTFAFGAVRLAFERDGSRTRLRVTPPEAEALTYWRVK